MPNPTPNPWFNQTPRSVTPHHPGRPKAERSLRLTFSPREGIGPPHHQGGMLTLAEPDVLLRLSIHPVTSGIFRGGSTPHVNSRCQLKYQLSFPTVPIEIATVTLDVSSGIPALVLCARCIIFSSFSGVNTLPRPCWLAEGVSHSSASSAWSAVRWLTCPYGGADRLQLVSRKPPSSWTAKLRR